VTNPQTFGVAHVTKSTFYWSAGMLYQSINQNNQITTHTYDNMSRPATVAAPAGGQTIFSYPNAQQVKVQKLISGSSCTGSNWTESWNEVDGFGRPSRSARANGNGGATAFDQADTCYDPVHATMTSTYPYVGSGISNGPNGSKQCSANTGDVAAYDGLGRTI